MPCLPRVHICTCIQDFKDFEVHIQHAHTSLQGALGIWDNFWLVCFEALYMLMKMGGGGEHSYMYIYAHVHIWMYLRHWFLWFFITVQSFITTIVRQLRYTQLLPSRKTAMVAFLSSPPPNEFGRAYWVMPPLSGEWVNLLGMFLQPLLQFTLERGIFSSELLPSGGFYHTHSVVSLLFTPTLLLVLLWPRDENLSRWSWVWVPPKPANFLEK